MKIRSRDFITDSFVDIETDDILRASLNEDGLLSLIMNSTDTKYRVEAFEVFLPFVPKQASLFNDVVDKGEILKKKGIKKAIDHANVKNAGMWSDKAYQAIKLYLKSKKTGYTFLLEDIRVWAEDNKLLPEPPSKRAWGGIIVKVRNEGLIYKNGHGTVKNENAHKCFAAMWTKI